MTQPDVQEATIRPFLVGIKQKYIQNAHWWILDKITTNRPIWPKLDRNVSNMTIPKMCSTIPWHNPTYKGTYLTHLSVQEVTIGPFLGGIGRKYIQHDPWWLSDKITTHPDVQEATVWPFFFGDWTEIGWKWSLECIGLHHDPSGRTRGDCFFFFLQGLDGNIFNMVPDVEETRGQFCISRCLSCLLHFAFTEICCSHEGVPQGLPMCYLLTKRWP